LDLDDVSWTPYARDEIAQRKAHSTSYPYRLYSKGRVLGHKRGKRNTRPNTSLIQIEGVSNKEDAQFYLGKVPTLTTPHFLVLCADLMAFPQRVAYVYRAKREIAGSNVRVIWG
jgi:large subunit ribosomal protein L35Ae